MHPLIRPVAATLFCAALTASQSRRSWYVSSVSSPALIAASSRPISPSIAAGELR